MHSTINAARGLALALTLSLAAVASATAQESSPVGSWDGAVTPPGGAAIPLVLHVTEAEDGGLAATLDSPSQGAFGIPAASAVFEAGTLTVNFDAIPGGAGYEGTLSEDGSILEGSWSQGGGSVPVDLTRQEAPTE